MSLLFIFIPPPIKPIKSDHYLLKSDMILPHNVGADVFTTGFTGPLALTALGERCPVIPVPFTAATGPVKAFKQSSD